jgi:N-acetylmuramoyl-L-alanine amidase
VIFKIKRLTAAALILCVCFIAALSLNLKQQYVSANANVKTAPQIILDAGHGGFDGGAVAQDGTVEKNINLNIVLSLANFLRQSGFEVILTRQNDVSTDDVETDKIATRKKSDLKNRLDLMKDYPDAVFVSVHLNKFTTSAASGSQVFYSKYEDSKVLGECIQKSIVSLLQPENTRVNKQATSSTYLLHRATIPAVLVECGFLSNKAELEKLKTKDYQNKMAFSIYCGILEYFKGEK